MYIYFITTQGKKLYRLKYSENSITVWDLPKRAGAAVLRDTTRLGGMPYLMAFEDGFALYNPDTGKTRYLQGDYKQV